MRNVLSVLDARYRFAELEQRFQHQTLAMATSLISLIDLRDCYTAGHSARVASHVRNIAMELGLSDEEVETAVFAASLHDIGNIGIPDHVLLKPTELSEEEFGWIRKHPEWGWMALRNVDGFQEAALLILHHHEHMDGSGYPSQLKAAEIPVGSRLITVADSYDALTTNRPYRTARSRDEALAELQRCAGTHFDVDVVNALSKSLDRFDPQITQGTQIKSA
jgi:HD-GYP domain-containing protein (c-di-GMP phosphodiesterase class II)